MDKSELDVLKEELKLVKEQNKELYTALHDLMRMRAYRRNYGVDKFYEQNRKASWDNVVIVCNKYLTYNVTGEWK